MTAKNHNKQVKETGIHKLFPHVTPKVIPLRDQNPLKRKQFTGRARNWPMSYISRILFLDHKRLYMHHCNRWKCRQ